MAARGPLSRVDDRTAGRVLHVVAAVGVVVAVLGAVVGWSLMGRLDAAASDTLELTAETLVSVENTIVVAEQVVGSTVVALESVEATLADLSNTADTAQPLLESLADLGSDAAPNLESAASTLRSLEDLGATIDLVLVTLSSLPIAPRYDPDTSLAEEFGRLADDIEPLADTLRDTSDQMGPTVAATARLQERVDELGDAVSEVRADLAESDALLSEYATAAQSARDLTERTATGLGIDVVAARILVVLAALTFAVGQLVPYWYGHELLRRAEARG